MGWTTYYATIYKNGKIDKKAEMTKELEKYGYYTVLKCSIVKGVYYGALKENHSKKVIPIICLLSTIDNSEFGYKDMTETVKPYATDCPKSIIKLLTPINQLYTEPTSIEWAQQWRNECLAK